MKEFSPLNLTTVMIVFVVVYIIVFKLMWDWQKQNSTSEPSSYQFLVVLGTTALLGLLAFIGYIILCETEKQDKMALLILWGLAVQVLIAAYVAYFSKNLKTETGYLLMILIVLHAVFAIKLRTVNMYGSLAAFSGGLLSLFLYARSL